MLCLAHFPHWADSNSTQSEWDPSSYPLDFKKLTDEEVLAHLQELTPPGTKPREVAKAIVNVLWEGDQKHRLHYYDRPYYMNRDSFGEAYISAHISDYQKGWRTFQVFVIYAFKSDQTLEQILVRRQEVKSAPQFGGN